MYVLRIVVLTVLTALAAAPARAQSIDDLIALKRVTGTAALSPDGRRVAFAVREANWADNAYETEVWIADARTAASARPLTSGAKSSSQPAWSPDGTWVAFLSDRSDTRQLYRLSVEGGEAEALTSGTEGVTAFAWSHDGARIAYTMTDPVTPAMKEREEKFGDYTHEDHDHRMAQLHVLDVATKTSTALTAGAFVVGALRLVARRHADRLRPSAQQRRRQQRQRRYLGGGGRLAPGDAARHPGRSRQQPQVVARRTPDCLPVGDGQALLLLPERRAGRGQRQRRGT